MTFLIAFEALSATLAITFSWLSGFGKRNSDTLVVNLISVGLKSFFRFFHGVKSNEAEFSIGIFQDYSISDVAKFLEVISQIRICSF